MNGYHKKYTLHCEALSPIHIGSGEALSRWEYVVINNELYYVTDKFWELLLITDSGAFDKLVSRINQSNSASLTEEFDRLPNKAGLKQTLKKSEMEFRPLLDKNRKPIIRNINRFAGTPNYYIPGSSLKGAFRGAYEVMKVDAEHFQTKEENFLDSEEKRKFFYNELKGIFAEFSQVSSSISKSFQNIRIADITISQSDLTILPISFNGNKKDTIEFHECIKKGMEFKVEIIDTSTDKFWSNVKKEFTLFYKVNFLKLKQRSLNKDLEEFYTGIDSLMKENPSSSLFRCGFGSGQLCNSALSPWTRFSSDTTLFWQGIAANLLKKGELGANDIQYPSSPKKELHEHTPLGWIKINKMTESINQ